MSNFKNNPTYSGESRPPFYGESVMYGEINNDFTCLKYHRFPVGIDGYHTKLDLLQAKKVVMFVGRTM